MNELHQLIARMLEDQLSTADAESLKTLLANDPEARRIYTEQCQLHARFEMDASLKETLEAAPPIDLDDGENSTPAERPNSILKRFPSYAGIVAASAAISFIGVLTVLNFSSETIPHNPSASKTALLSPQEVYEQADFPESGNLKRPPTNFATITPSAGEKTVSFNRDIRPIFSENCYNCHGPDANSREAELRLDIEANAFAVHGDFDPAIQRGDPENSPLYKRITSTLKSDIMPPPNSHKLLSDDQKQKIRQWIEEGAEWEAHWAFLQPKKHPAPRSDWGKGPIDSFLFEEMEKAGLRPNPEADKATLARRLALDITGLPLNPQEVDRFVADTSPNAYENLVDRLLDNPAFGENQARYWLDAARYSDTHGLHLDNYREIWPYRDWVIDAFNDNKPFDTFIVEQLAGDLLPNPTIEQRVATGFNRCNPSTSEGGAIDDEYRAIYAKDRVETTATVFLGLTMGCASCHDHKFDPLTQTDFYQFSAFFNNIDGPIMDGNAYDTKPVAVMPPPEHETAWAKIQPEFEAFEKRFNLIKKERKASYQSWLESSDPEFPEDLDIPAYKLALSKEKSSRKDEQIKGDAEFEMGDSVELPIEFNQLDPNGAFTVAFTYKTPTLNQGVVQPIVSKFDGDRGWRISLVGGDNSQRNRYRVKFELINSLKSESLISLTTKSTRRGGPPTPGKSIKFSVSYDGSGLASGITITSPSRQAIEKRMVVDNLTGSCQTNAPLQFHEAYRSEDDASDSGFVSRLDFFPSHVPAYLFSQIANSSTLKKTFEKPADERKEREKNNLEAYYFDMIDPQTSELKIELALLENRYKYIYDQSNLSLIMKEKDEDAFAFMLERGEYDKQGDKVYPELPEALGSLPANAPRNRMSLAQWLIDSNNPLTARVTVNRIWQNFFGIGLVKTSEDFGATGENPSHPELLDWLAISFQENGWDIKAFIKNLVTTAAYRQDSKIAKDALTIDPENRLLARGPRYRLDGETLRDQALYVSGSLRDDLGGPPVKPYQPEGIWDAVAYSGSNTRYYQADSGDALYRRSLYTFWKRTAPPPNMVVFDAPSRENCSVRRDRTNTPLQALTLMNDPQYVEAARNLAQRALSESKESSGKSITTMYRLALGMNPPKKHREILERSYSNFHESFKKTPSNASDLISLGDSKPNSSVDPVTLASLTMVANQIMNLDSFINKY
jgi:hypothetical protein